MIKKNTTVIVLQDFKNETFKKVQNLLINKYEILKKKGSIYTPTFRNATNNLLFSLRNYELKIQVKESVIQVKNALKNINEVLKQAKKE
jgi:hypothetical protein